ncbi:MAG: VPDSG-CTERM sorting domain-containing protein, partial [Thermoanaerobaculia bacterium]
PGGCDSAFGAVPEPSTALLLLGGLSGLAVWRRRLY